MHFQLECVESGTKANLCLSGIAVLKLKMCNTKMCAAHPVMSSWCDHLDAKGVDCGADGMNEDVIWHCEFKLLKASMARKFGCQCLLCRVDVCDSCLKIGTLQASRQTFKVSLDRERLQFSCKFSSERFSGVIKRVSADIGQVQATTHGSDRPEFD